MKRRFLLLFLMTIAILGLSLLRPAKAEAALPEDGVFSGPSFWKYSAGCPTSNVGKQTGYILGADQYKKVAYNQNTLTVKLYGSIGVCPNASFDYRAYWSHFEFGFEDSRINNGQGIDDWYFAAFDDYIAPGQVRNNTKEITIDVSGFPRDGGYYSVALFQRGGSYYDGYGWDYTGGARLDIGFQMEGIGNISVSKYYPSSKTTGDYTGIPDDVSNALVKLYARTNYSDRYQFATSNDTDFASSKPNPFIRNTVLTSQGLFRARVFIPSGKKVSRLVVAGSARSCISGTEDGSSYCETPSFSVQGGKTTEVNVFYDDGAPPPPPPPAPEVLYYPFIQAKNGNVIVNGQINGQSISGTSYGAPDSKDKYAEYLIISAVSGGGPFCSSKNYILTNTSATTGNCGNGLGYGNLPDYLFGGSSDKVYTAVSRKYDSLTNAACKPTSTPTGTISSDPTICPDGTIYKLNGRITLQNLTLNSGRVTLLVNGDVTLNGNIGYGNTSVNNANLEALKRLPNLSIVTNANIKINSSVTSVNASLYSVGYINTCGDRPLPQLCNTQLRVFGGMAAKNGLVLARVNGANGLTGHEPAELITFYPLSALLATPGTSSFDFSETSDVIQVDPTEYPPRF